jgi:adenylate cyclase
MISQLRSKINSFLSYPYSLNSSWSIKVIVTGTIVTAVIYGIRQLGGLQSIELWAFDQLVRSQPDEGADDRLLVVGITEEDIQTLPSFPISDGILAEALTNLQTYEPKAIALDILRDIPVGEGRPALAEALSAPNLVAACFMNDAETPGSAPPPEVEYEQVGFADLPQDVGGIQRRSLLVAYPPDTDAGFKTQHICNNPENELISLAFGASLLYLEAEGIQADLNEEEELVLGSTILKPLAADGGSYQGIDSAGYQIPIRYRSRQPSALVSLSDVLDNNIDPDLVRDRVVLMGYTATSAQDIFYTPYSTGSNEDYLMPGVFVHAQIVSQLLSAVLDNRPLIWYFPQWVEFFWILGWSLIGGLLTWRKFRHLWIVGFLVAGTTLIIVWLCYGAFLSGGWIPLVPPILAVGLTALGVVLIDRVPVIQKLLRIEVEVDWEKVRKEADKLVKVNSDLQFNPNQVDRVSLEAAEKAACQSYLQELQRQAQQRRKVKKSDRVPQAPSSDNVLAQLQDKVAALKARLQSRLSRSPEQAPITPPTSTVDNPEAIAQKAYLDRLLKKAKELRNSSDSSET